MTDTPDEVIVHGRERCGGCGADLVDVALIAVERRQVMDASKGTVSQRSELTPGQRHILAALTLAEPPLFFDFTPASDPDPTPTP